MSGLLSPEVFQTIDKEPPVVDRPDVIKFSGETSAVRPPGICSGLGLCLEKRPPLVCRAGASQAGSARISFVKNKKPWSLVVNVEGQSRKGERTSPVAESVKAEEKSLAELKDFIDATRAISGALQSIAESPFQVLKVNVRSQCFVENTFFNELEVLHEQRRSYTWDQHVSLVLYFSNISWSAHSDRFSSRCILKEDIYDAVRVMSSMKTSRAQRRISAAT